MAISNLLSELFEHISFPYASFFLLLLPLVYLLLKPLFANPLSRLPAPSFLCHITPLWVLWVRYRGTENRTLKAAHQKYGPIIRLGPREVSVNCVQGGIREVYGGAMEKDVWYDFFANFGG